MRIFGTLQSHLSNGLRGRSRKGIEARLYHRHRPDVIVGLITTQAPKEIAPTDCELLDWRQAGLHQPSFFRLFPVTLLQREVRLIGRLSESDWKSVRVCFKAGFGSD